MSSPGISMRSLIPAVLAGYLICLPLQSSRLPTRDEILARVYPGAAVSKETLFLTAEQMKRARRLAGTEIPSALIARFTLSSPSGPAGRAYVDTHVIRTKKESLLICLDQEGRVLRIEATAFLEPPEYQLPPKAREQYMGKSWSSNLILGDGIRSVAGATLTSRAVALAVRRVLAIDQVLVRERAAATEESRQR